MSFETRQQPGIQTPQGTLCLRCGTAVKPGKKFCSRCGCPISAIAVNSRRTLARSTRSTACDECGFENHRSDRFCKGCGGLLIALPARDPGSVGLQDVPAESAALESRPVSPAAEAGAGALETTFQVSEREAAATALDATLAEPMPVVLAESKVPAAESKPRESTRLRARRAGMVAAGTLIAVAALVLWSTRHDTVKGLARTSPTTTPLSNSLSSQPVLTPVSTTLVEATPAGEGAPRRSIPLAEVASRRKTKIEKPQRLPRHEAANARSAPPVSSGGTQAGPAISEGTPGPKAPSVVATLDPRVVASEMDGLKPSAVASPAELTSGSPSKSTAEAPARITIVSLPSSASAPAEAELAPPLTRNARSADIRIGGLARPAQLLAHPSPAYPASARTRRVQGTVHLLATVRTDGTLSDLKVSSGDKLLAGAALDAVRTWRYQPALLNGRPIQSQTSIQIEFRLPN